MDALKNKLIEFNGQVPESLRLQEDQFDALLSLGKSCKIYLSSSTISTKVPTLTLFAFVFSTYWWHLKFSMSKMKENSKYLGSDLETFFLITSSLSTLSGISPIRNFIPHGRRSNSEIIRTEIEISNQMEFFILSYLHT